MSRSHVRSEDKAAEGTDAGDRRRACSGNGEEQLAGEE